MQRLSLTGFIFLSFATGVSWSSEKCLPVAKLETSTAYPGLLKVPKNLGKYKAIDFSIAQKKGEIPGCYIKEGTSKCQYITFSWGNICSDGFYTFKVTPEQVILYTGHNNPNPSSLLWYKSINEKQYLSVLNFVKKKTKSFLKCSNTDCEFSAPFKERLQVKYEKFQLAMNNNESALKSPEDSCDDQNRVLAKNLARLFELIFSNPTSKKMSGLASPKASELNNGIWIKEEGVVQQTGDIWCK